MKQSWEQRLYNLQMSKKDLQKECANRGRKVGYDSIGKVLSNSNEVLYSTEKNRHNSRTRSGKRYFG